MRRGGPSAGSCKVSTENICLIYSGIIQKSIRGLGVGLILTDQGNAFSQCAAELLEKNLESMPESFVHERTPFNFLLHPLTWRLIRGNSAPPAPRASPLRHAAPRVDLTRNAYISHVRMTRKIISQAIQFQ